MNRFDREARTWPGRVCVCRGIDTSAESGWFAQTRFEVLSDVRIETRGVFNRASQRAGLRYTYDAFATTVHGASVQRTINQCVFERA